MADLDIFRTFGGSNTLMLLECTKKYIYEVKDWSYLSLFIGPLKPSRVTDYNDLIEKCKNIFIYKRDYMSWEIAKKMYNLNKTEKIKFYSNNGKSMYDFGKTCSIVFAIETCCKFISLNKINGTEKLHRSWCCVTAFENEAEETNLKDFVVYFILNCIQDSSDWFLNNGLINSWFYNSIDDYLNNLSNILIEDEESLNKFLNANEILSKDSVLCYENYGEQFLNKTIIISD